MVDMYTPTEIIEHPQNEVVDLHKMATFTCETNGGDVTFWKVNGASDIPPEMLDDVVSSRKRVGANTRLTLDIHAKAEYNQTTIQCITTVIGGDSEESEIVTLTIRGILHIHIDVSMLYPPHRFLDLHNELLQTILSLSPLP